MDQELAPFLLLTENHIQPETPTLKLGLEIGSKLTADSRCFVLVTIYRTHDSHKDPCIFNWSKEDDGAAFLLFRHTPNGLRKIDIESYPSPAPQVPLVVDGWNSSLWELAPKERVSFMMTLPTRYRAKMERSEKYELVWPGGEISIWDWGTKMQHLGQELGLKSPKICLPAAQSTLEFDKFGQELDARGSPPPIADSERVPGAPRLTVILKCDKTIPWVGIADVKITVVYEAPAGSPAITFRTYQFHSDYWLYRRRANIWEAVEDDTTGFMIIDDPDVFINVSQDKFFTSLQAGQTWTISHELQGQGKGPLPDDMSVGDVFRYVFKGVEIDWWDWGDSSDHAETFVRLPCFISGAVKDPKNNDGRPQLIVPASNSIEFAIV